MIRWLLALLAFLGWAAQPAQAELLWSQRFDSAALGGPMKYSVYLPTGYHDPRQKDRLYPVVYLLHGVGDNERSWPAYARLEAMMDRLIGAGDIAPVIVVAPAGKKSWWSDTADVGGAGNYLTAVRDDLPQHIEATYRAMTSREGRAITGQSMGAFGAFRIAFERPDLYVATAGMSPALWWRVDESFEMFPRGEKIFDGSFGRPFQARRFLEQHPRAFLDTLKAYDGEIGVFLHSADDDGFGGHISTMKLYMLMQEKKIKTELRIVDGGHDWKVWRRDLPEILRWFDGFFPKPAS